MPVGARAHMRGALQQMQASGLSRNSEVQGDAFEMQCTGLKAPQSHTVFGLCRQYLLPGRTWASPNPSLVLQYPILSKHVDDGMASKFQQPFMANLKREG